MSLKTRLFLGLAALVALLVLAQTWWMRGLTRELSAEVDDVAFQVGHSVVSRLHVLSHAERGWSVATGGGPEGGEPVDEEVETTEIVVRRHSFPHAATASDTSVIQIVVDRDPGELPAEHLRELHPAAAAERTAVPEERPAAHGERPTAPEERPTAPEEGNFAWHFFGDDGTEDSVLELKGDGLSERIPIPRQGLRQKIERFERQLLLGALGFLSLGLLLAAFVAQRIAAPLERLTGAARKVGDGALGTRVEAAAPGEVGAALAAFNQMSERLADLDLRHRQLVARRHLGEIGEIARGLAHSLRNPLNALGLSVDELAGRAADEESGAIAGAARRQIRRIDGAIRSFLALASHGEGRNGVAVEEVELDELARDVALEAIQDHRQPGRGQAPPRIEVEAADDLPALSAAPAELRAVVQALVVNAVEASSAGGRIVLRVEASAAGDEARRLRLTVEDEGPGLADEVRARLFTPHLTTKPNGAGMGLFLAQRIASGRYGGSLRLADRPGGGTRAILEIGSRCGESADG